MLLWRGLFPVSLTQSLQTASSLSPPVPTKLLSPSLLARQTETLGLLPPILALPHPFQQPVHFSWVLPPMNYVLPPFQSLVFRKIEKSSPSYGSFKALFFTMIFKKYTFNLINNDVINYSVQVHKTLLFL